MKANREPDQASRPAGKYLFPDAEQIHPGRDGALFGSSYTLARPRIFRY